MKAGIEGIKGLKQFPSIEGLPETEKEIKLTLQSPFVEKICCFALGPAGTNISQACKQWVDKMGIEQKTTLELCETPEESLERTRKISGEGEIGIFWTCAVYYNLYKLFFENPDTLPFFIQHTMLLDEMQLAVRPETVSEIIQGQIPQEWKIASHPSPAPLLLDLMLGDILKANSNGEAARMCAEGQVEACVTTESARKLHGLVKLHSFGSPPMVFFGGITSHGARLIKKSYHHKVQENQLAGYIR